MPTQPMIEKMPLNKINISKEQDYWLSSFFTDIIARNAAGMDLQAMLRDAYVMGFHHCMTACGVYPQEQPQGGDNG